jgi:transcriptional regulator with XRE-family HTH domain
MAQSIDKGHVVLYVVYNEGGRMSLTFGARFKALHIKAGLTLRQFCEANGYDPGNISRLERGVFPPPESTEKVEDYARALGLKRGSEEWVEFLDAAAAGRGEIPADLMADKAVAGRLPLLFRTLRGHKLPREKRKDLIDFLRGFDRHAS